MNARHEPSVVVGAWLEEGPNELPESTRRAIAVGVRTTRQSRRSTWFPRRFPSDRSSLAALATVAVIVLAVAGLAVFRLSPAGSDVGGHAPAPSPSPAPPQSVEPSATPSGSTILVIPAMTETHVSARYGYSVRYPADWSVSEASREWWPPDWKVDPDSDVQTFDFIRNRDEWPLLRAASTPLMASLPDVNDWIDEFMTFGDPICVPPREAQELISIDGAPGRLRDSCGELEATVVIEGRAYMFSMWVGEGVTNGRELFDAFAATIDLRPEDAAPGSPRP